MIEAKNISLSFGQREILKSASFTISDGDKIGIVGRNGSGKTTLLHLIEGRIQPDEGLISISPNALVASIDQKVPRGDMLLKEYVLASNRELARLWANLEKEKDSEIVAQICSKIDDLDGYNQDYKAAQILNGIGFSDNDISHKVVNDLPGGLKMRLAMATLLFCQPDVMLLDEPSNHLDMNGMAWLADYLKRYKGTVLVVSHDADLLDAVTNKTLFCANGQARLYSGNFTLFQRQRAQETQNLERTVENIAEKKQKIVSFADKFRGVSSKARQVQSKLKMLERFNSISLPIEERAPDFHFCYSPGKDGEVIRLSDADIGYDNKTLLEKVQLVLRNGETIGILGANGGGKTTLLRTLSGNLPLISGRLTRNPKISVAYLGQIDADKMSSQFSVLDHVASLHPNVGSHKLRAQLAKIGFDENKVFTSFDALSGGERTKLLIMLLGMKPSNVLILDEPTNHLDYDSKISIIRALSEYPGAKVIVSHDSFFLASCADRFIAVRDGKTIEVESVSDYLLHSKNAKKKDTEIKWSP